MSIGQPTAGSPLNSHILCISYYFATLPDPVHIPAWVDILHFLLPNLCTLLTLETKTDVRVLPVPCPRKRQSLLKTIGLHWPMLSISLGTKGKDSLFPRQLPLQVLIFTPILVLCQCLLKNLALFPWIYILFESLPLQHVVSQLKFRGKSWTTIKQFLSSSWPFVHPPLHNSFMLQTTPCKLSCNGIYVDHAQTWLPTVATSSYLWIWCLSGSTTYFIFSTKHCRLFRCWLSLVGISIPWLNNLCPTKLHLCPQNAFLALFFTICPDPPILCPDPPILCPAFYVRDLFKFLTRGQHAGSTVRRHVSHGFES